MAQDFGSRREVSYRVPTSLSREHRDSDLEGRVLSSHGGGSAICEMDELPENLSALSDERLRHERNARDDTLLPLFRRSSSLSKFEMRELRRIYNERVRLARWMGRSRRDT